jgi:hypothetical protein
MNPSLLKPIPAPTHPYITPSLPQPIPTQTHPYISPSLPHPTHPCPYPSLHQPAPTPTQPYINPSLPQPIPEPPTCCRSRWSWEVPLRLADIPDGFSKNETVYAITSFQPHTCAPPAVTDNDKPVKLTLKQSTNNRSMTSKQLSLIIRDEYHQAARSGQPWTMK